MTLTLGSQWSLYKNSGQRCMDILVLWGVVDHMWLGLPESHTLVY